MIFLHVCLCTLMPRLLGRVLDSLELEQQVLVSQYGDAGIEPRPLEEEQVFLIEGAVSCP